MQIVHLAKFEPEVVARKFDSDVLLHVSTFGIMVVGYDLKHAPARLSLKIFSLIWEKFCQFSWVAWIIYKKQAWA